MQSRENEAKRAAMGSNADGRMRPFYLAAILLKD
jgi:hypothetical protein